MKKLVFGLFLFVGLICRSEAQLDGEYTFDVAKTFNNSPYVMLDSSTFDEGVIPEFLLVISGVEAGIWPQSKILQAHNPKTGVFSLKGDCEYLDVNFIKELNLGAGWIDHKPSCLFSCSGKTYLNKKSSKLVFDISGVVDIKGVYNSPQYDECKIKKGTVNFSGRGLDLLNSKYELEDTSRNRPQVSVNVLINIEKEGIKKSNRFGTVYWSSFGGKAILDAQTTDYYFIGGENDDPLDPKNYKEVSGKYSESMQLNLSGMKLLGLEYNGFAEIFYMNKFVADNSDDTSYGHDYVYPETPAKKLRYSVKGTSKNGIATLNLTGLGVIKGLKATIYIDEDTEEIIQNGKNSITLYGQTIKY